MNKIINNYISVLQKYAQFTGRASREEYWSFVLVNFLIAFSLGILQGVLEPLAEIFSLLSSLYALVTLIPSFAVGVRRMHDIGKSGWSLLLGFIPLVGWVIMLMFLIRKGDEGENEYGPSPVGVSATSGQEVNTETPETPVSPETPETPEISETPDQMPSEETPQESL
jgi:uncharacterized membrane protein YhaH (DUF805 family)